jgi:RNA polymerase sigma-70 factor (ECF subfamily)
MHLPTSNRGDTERISYAELLALADEHIMRELQAGNGDAFAMVYKRYHRLVHVTALHILRDAGEAEDLTQTVFLEIYRNAGQYDTARGTLKVWLLQYAYSRSMNRRNYLRVRQFHNQTRVEAIEESRSIWSPVRLPMQESVHLTTEGCPGNFGGLECKDFDEAGLPVEVGV